MKGFKGFLNRSKGKLAVIGATCMSAVAMAVGASANTGLTSDTKEQITSQFTAIGSDVTSIIIPIIGIGLGIFAIIIGVKFGKRMFKTVSS